MGHLRTVRNGMVRRGSSIRQYRETTRMLVLVKQLSWGKKIWRKVTVRTRNMLILSVGRSKPIKHAELIRDYATTLRKRYSRRFLRG
jgi:hypothetical protein